MKEAGEWTILKSFHSMNEKNNLHRFLQWISPFKLVFHLKKLQNIDLWSVKLQLIAQSNKNSSWRCPQVIFLIQVGILICSTTTVHFCLFKREPFTKRVELLDVAQCSALFDLIRVKKPTNGRKLLNDARQDWPPWFSIKPFLTLSQIVPWQLVPWQLAPTSCPPDKSSPK